MTAAAVNASVHIVAFEKGLKSRSLSEQLSTVVTTGHLLDDHPFPLVVNQVVIRLAEAFRDGSNEVRLCVARVLAECSERLRLVFSGSEVLKRVMLVSHSNDPEARALTLMVLAGLSPIFPEDKQVHHLIVESLATDNDMEFKAACHAMTAFTHLSSEFSSTVIPQLWQLLESANTSVSRKVLLVPVFAQMKAEVQTTQEVFALSNSLLETCTQTELVCSLLDSMTTLAEATRYGIPEQLSILLNAVNRGIDNLSLSLCAFNNLKRLAKHSHVWSDDHLNLLQTVRPKIVNNGLLFYKYLQVLVKLTQTVRPTHVAFFSGLLTDLGYLATTKSYEHRISFIRFSCNVYCSMPNDVAAARLVNTCASVINNIDLVPAVFYKQFFATLGQLFCCPALKDQNVTDLLGVLLKISPQFKQFDVLIELYCRLADSLPLTVPILNKWATEVASQMTNMKISKIAFLLYPPGLVLVSPIPKLPVASDYDRYAISRTAFRNGHWKDVAYPQLADIDTNPLSFTTARWIEFLRELADSQLVEFSSEQLEHQKRALSKAKSVVEILLSYTSETDPYLYARDFTNCLLLSSRALHNILMGLSTFIQLPSQFAVRGTEQRIRNVFVCAASSLETVINAWSKLARSSFGADHHSHDVMAIMHTLYTVLHFGVLNIIGTNPMGSLTMPVIRKDTASTKMAKQLTTWAIAKMEKLPLGKLNETTLAQFMEVLKSVALMRVCIPHVFFQQPNVLKFKLAVPTGQNGEVTVPPNQMIPIQLDGAISTTEKGCVDSITVKANIQYALQQANNTCLTQTIELIDNSYFTAQFLLSFKRNCHIDFSVNFTDTTDRQLWSSNTTASLKVNISDYPNHDN